MLVLDHPPQDDYYIARQIYGEVSRKQSVKAKKITWTGNLVEGYVCVWIRTDVLGVKYLFLEIVHVMIQR